MTILGVGARGGGSDVSQYQFSGDGPGKVQINLIYVLTIGENPAMPNYLLAQLDEVPGVPCPCGTSRRAFATPENIVATLHLVDIKKDAELHYHKKMTEIYLILEGEGFLELDGERVPVKPMTTVLIKPGCRHRAIGKLRIINIPVPAFDPADEWVVEESPKPESPKSESSPNDRIRMTNQL